MNEGNMCKLSDRLQSEAEAMQRLGVVLAKYPNTEPAVQYLQELAEEKQVLSRLAAKIEMLE